MSKFIHVFALILAIHNTLAAYDQWMDLNIINLSKNPIKITGSLEWGKWYVNGDKSQEASAPDLEIAAGGSTRIAATGRSDAASGTEGTINISDASGTTQLVTIKFDCPWSGSNSFVPTVHQPTYVSINHSSWEKKGALGEMVFRVIQF